MEVHVMQEGQNMQLKWSKYYKATLLIQPSVWFSFALLSAGNENFPHFSQ